MESYRKLVKDLVDCLKSEKTLKVLYELVLHLVRSER